MASRSIALGAILLGLASAARAALPQGPADAFWRRDVSAAAVDAQSPALIGWLAQQGGFGGGAIQIDFSIEVLETDESAPLVPFTPSSDWWDPDCDADPVPLPPGGALEGENGYACTQDGDCHLIAWLPATQKLYEMWRANQVGADLFGGCLAIWQLDRHYDAFGRGRDCSSADASGFPIAPLLFDAEEVAAGAIDHAIRFILPNSRIRHRTYVAPASHATGAASGGSYAPPYGARLRLRADFPLASLPNDGARTVARALQKYGMLLADGGTVALTARSDHFTATKWDGLLGPHDLAGIAMTDFEMIDAGERIAWTGDCVRAPEPAARVAASIAIGALLGLGRARARAR